MIPIKMWNDGNELNKPQNSSQFNKNTVFSKETSSIHNEYGFRIIYEYNVLTQSDLEPIGFIPLIANKVVAFSVVNNNPNYTSEIGIIDNDIYKPILRDNTSINISFGFSEEHLIQGSFKVGLNAELIVYWVDGKNTDKWLNLTKPQVTIDNQLRLAVANEIQQMIGYRINSEINIDLVGVETGGSLETGVYFIVPVYIADNNETHSLSISNPIQISAADNWGAPAGIISNKSIQLTIPAVNLDTSFQSVKIYVIAKINQSLKAFEYATYANTGNNIDIAIPSLVNSKEVTVDSIIINTALYKSALTIVSLDDVLYKGHLKAFDELNLQPYVNNIGIQWVSKELDLNNGLSNGYKNAVNTFYNKSFMWDEVYGFAISFLIEDSNVKYETRAYHIPGRQSKSITLGTWTGNETDPVNLIGDLSFYNGGTPTDITPGGQIYNINSGAKVYQAVDTADDSTVINNMGYWENQNERYPDNENWDVKDETGTVIDSFRNDNVRHHKFPDPFEHDIKMHKNYNGGDYGEVNILGVKLHNIVIPDELANKVIGYKLYYVKRDINNRTILGQGMLTPAHAFHDQGSSTATLSTLYNSFGCGNAQDLYKESAQYDFAIHAMGLTNMLYEIPDDHPGNVYNQGINFPYSGSPNTPNYEYGNPLKTAFSLTSGYAVIRPFDLMSQNVSVNSAAYIKNLFRIKSKYLLTYQEGDSSVLNPGPQNFSYGFTFIPDINFYGIDRINELQIINPTYNLIRKLDIKNYIENNQSAAGLGFSGNILTKNFTKGILTQFTNKLLNYNIPSARNGNTQGQDLFIVNLENPPSNPVVYADGYASPYLSNICAYKEDLFVGFENQILGYTGQSYGAAKILGGIQFGSNIISNVSSIKGVKPGMQVFGVGIPSGTIVSIVNPTSIQISNPATATTTVHFTLYDQEDTFGGDTFTGWYGERTICDFSELAKNTGNDRTLAILRGLHYYICQSTSNTQLRHTGPNANETFFPYTTAENMLAQSPDNNNYYGYNADYSSINDIKQPLINTFNINTYETLFTNRIIRSAKNNPELDSDNYLIYEAGNLIDVGMELGKIENLDNYVNRLIIQLENGIMYTVGREQLDVGNAEAYIGAGDIFLARPKSVVSGQYGGTIGRFNTTVTPYGLLYADPNLGNVYAFTGEEVHEISKEGFERFFKDHLPFKLPKQLNNLNYNFVPEWDSITTYNQYDIVKYNGNLWRAKQTSVGINPVEGINWTNEPLPEYNIRTTVSKQGLGIVAGYDPKFLRYILRKKDYSYVDTNAFYQGIFGTNLIDNYVDGVTLITYNNTLGIYYNVGEGTPPANGIQIGTTGYWYVPINLDDYPEDFKSESFTISYYPEVKGWVSWHDYEPKLFTTQEQALYSSNGNIYKHNIIESPFFYDTDPISFETEPLFTINEKTRLASIQTVVDDKNFAKISAGQVVSALVPIYDETFDSYFVYDSYQISKASTNLVPLSNTRNAEGIWNFNDFRDYTANQNDQLLTYSSVWEYDLNTLNIDNNKHWSKLKKFTDYWYATRLKKQINNFEVLIVNVQLLSVAGNVGVINQIGLSRNYVYRMNNSYFVVKSINNSTVSSEIVFLNTPPTLGTYTVNVFIPKRFSLIKTTPTIFKNYR